MSLRPLLSSGILVLSLACGGSMPQTVADMPNLDAARVLADITKLSSDEFQGRAPGSEGERLTVEYLTNQFKAAGLETRIDAAGNLIGRRKGRRSALGTIMLGSHSDTVPEGGRFDGIAGVASALEVARALDDADIRLDHDLEIVDFLAEEVSIFGVSCIGSRGMSGTRPSEWLARQSDGTTLEQAIAQVGGYGVFTAKCGCSPRVTCVCCFGFDSVLQRGALVPFGLGVAGSVNAIQVNGAGHQKGNAGGD